MTDRPFRSRLAERLAEVVKDHRIQQVDLDTLRAAYVELDPTGATGTESRALLSAAITELVAAQIVTLPRSNQHYENHASPALPRWVRRQSLNQAPRPAPAPPRVWRTELADAAQLIQTPAERALLDIVDKFIRDGGLHRPVVPHRERSIQLFGDEKRLDRLLTTRLFKTGALNLDLLRAYLAPLPLTAAYVTPPETEPTLFLFENHNTYASALRVARERAGTGLEVPAIGYTDGGRATRNIGGASLLDPVPERIFYFGDVDDAGLRIAAAASDAAEAAGLPAVRPAKGLYQRLFEVGSSADSKSGSISEAEAMRRAAWLEDEELVSATVDLLVQGKRLAQEWVGYEILSEVMTGCDWNRTHRHSTGAHL